MSGPSLTTVLPAATLPASAVPSGPASRCHGPSGAWLRRWLGPLLSLVLLLVLAGPSLPALAREPARPAIESVDLDSLPVQVGRTLALIRAGGPFPYRKDGVVFGNRERLLPPRPRGHYTEYTVPTPRARDRGARRIVAAGEPTRTDEFYYTDDHYQSFRRIREPG